MFAKNSFVPRVTSFSMTVAREKQENISEAVLT